METAATFTLAANSSETEVSGSVLSSTDIALWAYNLLRIYRWHHNQSHFTAPNSSNLTDTRSLRRSSVGFQNRGLYLLPPAPYQPSLSNPQLALNPYSLSQSLVSPTNVLSHNNVALSTEPQTHTVQQSEVCIVSQ